MRPEILFLFTAFLLQSLVYVHGLTQPILDFEDKDTTIILPEYLKTVLDSSQNIFLHKNPMRELHFTGEEIEVREMNNTQRCSSGLVKGDLG